MNVAHCPACAQPLSLPESASPDMSLECQHCGSVCTVDQCLPASADASGEPIPPAAAFNETAQEEFSQGEVVADPPESSAGIEPQNDEIELLGFDDDDNADELPMLDPEHDDKPLPLQSIDSDDDDVMPEFESAPIDSETESDNESLQIEEEPLLMQPIDSDDDDVMPEFESAPIDSETESDNESPQIEEEPLLIQPIDSDDDDVMPEFESAPIDSEAESDNELPPIEVESNDVGGDVESELGFTEFSREPMATHSDESDGDEITDDEDLESLDLAADTAAAATKRPKVAGRLGQIVCPDCHDPVRMPDSVAAADAEVRCPWCGSVNPMQVFSDQMLPPLELVSPGSALPAVHQQPQRDHAPVVEESEPEYASNEYAAFDNSPVVADGFEMSAHGLQPRPRRRQKPSIIKMLVQWFGGGVLGIGGALAILYFGFPEKFPKFLPFQPPSSRSSSSVGSNDSFTGNDSFQVADSDDSGFVISNENSQLLESIDLSASSAATDDGSDTEMTIAADEPAEPSSPIQPPPTRSLFEQRLQTAREAMSLVMESDVESPSYSLNRNSLYRSLADLAAAVADTPFSKQPKKEAARLLQDLATDRQLMTSLARLAPQWLASPRRSSEGIFLVAKLGNKTRAQSRPGYHSISLARYLGESNPAEPITVFGLLDDLMPHQDQNVMILAVIENNASDINADGNLLKLSAIEPL